MDLNLAFKSFLTRLHFFNGKAIDLNSSLISYEKLHETHEITTHSIGRFDCIQEADPVLFTLKCLASFQNNRCPILIPTETPAHQLVRIKNRLYDLDQTSQSFFKRDTLYYGCLTSGTTGEPKISFHSVLNGIENARAHCESFSIKDGDTIIQALPLTHTFGMVAYLFVSLIRKTHLHFLSLPLTPNNWDTLVQGSHLIHLSPAQARLLLKSKHKPTVSPKLLSVGGGLLHTSEFQALSEIFPRSILGITYGFTEAGPRVTTGFYQKNTHASELGHFVGQAISGVELKVLTENGMTAYGRGKLCVKSPSLQVNTPSNDLMSGYFVSNDEVHLTEQGAVYFIERGDDLIKVGGISVYPNDILTVFKDHYPHQDAVILKEPHPIYGEIPVLYYEQGTHPTLEASMIHQNLAPYLSPIQRPKKIIAVHQFPRNLFGKINRNVLKNESVAV